MLVQFQIYRFAKCGVCLNRKFKVGFSFWLHSSKSFGQGSGSGSSQTRVIPNLRPNNINKHQRLLWCVHSTPHRRTHIASRTGSGPIHVDFLRAESTFLRPRVGRGGKPECSCWLPLLASTCPLRCKGNCAAGTMGRWEIKRESGRAERLIFAGSRDKCYLGGDSLQRPIDLSSWHVSLWGWGFSWEE